MPTVLATIRLATITIIVLLVQALIVTRAPIQIPITPVMTFVQLIGDFPREVQLSILPLTIMNLGDSMMQ